VKCSIEILSVLCWEICDESGDAYGWHCPTRTVAEAVLGEMTAHQDDVVDLLITQVDQPCAVIYCAGCGWVWNDGVHLAPGELTLPAGDGWRVDPDAGMAWCPGCVHEAPTPDPLTVPVPIVDGQLPLPSVADRE